MSQCEVACPVNPLSPSFEPAAIRQAELHPAKQARNDVSHEDNDYGLLRGVVRNE